MADMSDNMNNEKLVDELAQHLVDLKGKNVTVLDVRGQCSWADWFVIATYNSQGHLKGLIEELDVWSVATMDGATIRPKKKQVNEWMLIDWDDIIVHLFSENARRYYDLENLWFNAPKKSYSS